MSSFELLVPIITVSGLVVGTFFYSSKKNVM